MDKEGRVVIAWKPFYTDAEAARLVHSGNLPGKGSEKETVPVAENRWRSRSENLGTVREAKAATEQLVEYDEVGSPCCIRIIHLGHVRGVFLGGMGCAYWSWQWRGASGIIGQQAGRLVEKMALALRADFGRQSSNTL